MSNMREILSAIKKLPPDEFLKLQERMDRIAEEMWQQEHQRLSQSFRRTGLSDADIDRLVLRRRYRGRAR
jgi:hypothetical protein